MAEQKLFEKVRRPEGITHAFFDHHDQLFEHVLPFERHVDHVVKRSERRRRELPATRLRESLHLETQEWLVFRADGARDGQVTDRFFPCSEPCTCNRCRS